YLEERNRRVPEDNRRQIGEAEERMRGRQEREAAEARRHKRLPGQPASRAWMADVMEKDREHTEEAIVVATGAPREAGCPPWVVLGVKAIEASGVRRRVMSR